MVGYTHRWESIDRSSLLVGPITTHHSRITHSRWYTWVYILFVLWFGGGLEVILGSRSRLRTHPPCRRWSRWRVMGLAETHEQIRLEKRSLLSLFSFSGSWVGSGPEEGTVLIFGSIAVTLWVESSIGEILSLG